MKKKYLEKIKKEKTKEAVDFFKLIGVELVSENEKKSNEHPKENDGIKTITLSNSTDLMICL